MGTIEDYNDLSNKVSSIINKLNSFLNNNCSIINSLKISYNINNESTRTVDRLVALNNTIENTSNYLKNTVLVAINNAQKALDSVATNSVSTQRANASSSSRTNNGTTSAKSTTKTSSNTNKKNNTTNAKLKNNKLVV